MEEVKTVYKIATAIVILCFILSISLTILMVSRNFWNRTENQVSQTVVNTQYMDAYQLSSYGKAVPVAAMWKTINTLDPNGEIPGRSTLHDFTMEVRDSNGNTVTTLYTRNALYDYMAYKGFMSYEEHSDGLFDISIILTEGG